MPLSLSLSLSLFLSCSLYPPHLQRREVVFRSGRVRVVGPRRRVRVGKADAGGGLDEKYVGDLIPAVRVQVPAGENGTENGTESGTESGTEREETRGEQRGKRVREQVRKTGKGTGGEDGERDGETR